VAFSGGDWERFNDGQMIPGIWSGGGGVTATGMLPAGGGFPGLSPSAYGGGGDAGNLAAVPGGDGGSGIVVVRYVALDAPNVPIISGTTAGNGQVTISVDPGTGAGDPPALFEVTASPGGATCTITLPATSCTITGLTNGAAYTFTATATNVGGTSTPSSPTVAVTPVAPPAPVPAPSDGGSNANGGGSSGSVVPSTAATATAGTPTFTRGAMRLPVTTTGAGAAVVLGNRTAGPGRGPMLMCTARRTFTTAATTTLICVPTAAAQTLRRRGAVRVRMVLAFTPRGGKATRTVVGSMTLPRIKGRAVPVTG
jgi:hypothetical protein